MFGIQMTDTLTDNGVIVKEGEVIATDVLVKHHHVDNSLSITYTDITSNSYTSTTRDINTGYSLIRDNDDTITGVLPKQEEAWYLFWNK